LSETGQVLRAVASFQPACWLWESRTRLWDSYGSVHHSLCSLVK